MERGWLTSDARPSTAAGLLDGVGAELVAVVPRQRAGARTDRHRARSTRSAEPAAATVKVSIDASP
jgi:hypothetical protein